MKKITLKKCSFEFDVFTKEWTGDYSAAREILESTGIEKIAVIDNFAFAKEGDSKDVVAELSAFLNTLGAPAIILLGHKSDTLGELSVDAAITMCVLLGIDFICLNDYLNEVHRFCLLYQNTLGVDLLYQLEAVRAGSFMDYLVRATGKEMSLYLNQLDSETVDGLKKILFIKQTTKKKSATNVEAF